jgi:hypothetical protein
MTDLDDFNSCGFAYLLHDAIITILLVLLGMAIVSPWWLI